jgi:predicted GTPase
MKKKRIVIMGAAGRDFHNFNVLYRDNANVEVLAFTAAQIPDIEGRNYPSSLAGNLYPNGIPIIDEQEIESIIKNENVDECLLSYSDLSFNYVMHLASRIIAAGSRFSMEGAEKTMLKSTKPVIAVVAVRTGCGKSQVSRAVADILRRSGKKVAVVRHPMPYGNLEKQRIMHFSKYEDLISNDCTIEEIEEYEPYIAKGFSIYSGVDYAAILKEAEKEADIILWDGGNNDTSFFKPDLTIVVTDPLRARHETSYYPGTVNFRMADIVLINKTDSAKPEQIETIVSNSHQFNPSAEIVMAESVVTAKHPELIQGKRVLVIEDGPTLTHGDMDTGAGTVAAIRNNAKEIIDPRPFVKGSLRKIYDSYPQIGNLIPAMGYGKNQLMDLQKSIEATDCDTVIIGTPVDLSRYVKISKPFTEVTYEISETAKKELFNLLDKKGFLKIRKLIEH